jgi:hypothetical protein
MLSRRGRPAACRRPCARRRGGQEGHRVARRAAEQEGARPVVPRFGQLEAAVGGPTMAWVERKLRRRV